MKNKIVYFLTLILVIGLTTGCMGKEEKSKEENNDFKVSEEYTELELFGATAKFKKQDPTNYWDCEDNFGAAEIDTVYIPTKNGKEVPNYYDQENTSGIIFQTSDDLIADKSRLKNSYKTWDEIDVEVKDIDDDLFKRHIKGQSSKLYFESYCFKYVGDFEGSNFDVYYKIELRIYKDDFTKEEQEKLISEYHTIINSFKLN